MNQVDQPPSHWPPIDLAREPEFELGRLRVRPARREVEAEGHQEILQRRTMQVLVALAGTSASVVSHEELNVRCWGGLSVSEDSISRCIGQLRRLALAWSPPAFEIVTVVGVGYRLEAETSLRQQPVSAANTAPSLPRSRILAAAAALLTLGLITGAVIWRGSLTSPPAPLAVAAFEPIGSAPQTLALARAVDAELLGALSASEIPARAASKQLPALLRDGTGLAVAGTIEDRGQDVHATARLVDVKTGTVVWQGEFDRPTGESKTLPIMLATQIADMVAIARFVQAGPKPVRDDAALNAVLTAHDALEWNDTHDWARRIQLARDVTRIAPSLAFGHSMLAWADTSAVRLGVIPTESDALADEARREAERAIELDPDDAGAYFALAMQQRGIAAREPILARALSRAGHPKALQAAVNEVQSNSLLSAGRIRDALPFADRALALNPLSPTEVGDVAKAYALAGRLDYSRELMAKALQRWPDQPDILDAQLFLLSFFGTADEALGQVAVASPRAKRNPEGTAVWRSYLSARSGDGPKRAQAATEVRQLALRSRFNPRIAVLMLAQLGDVDGAFLVMSNLRNDISDLSGFQYAPAAAPLRRDPRFLAFADRSGLLQYWRKTRQVPDLCRGPVPESWCSALGSSAVD